MKKIFSFICIALMCISLNSCTIYTMSDDYCDDYNRICYNCKSTPNRCYCNYKPDLNIRCKNVRRNDSNYKPITYRYYTVPVYDPNKPIKPSPKPHPHCHNHPRHHHNHNHNHNHNRR
jgi:hypothetical protein